MPVCGVRVVVLACLALSWAAASADSTGDQQCAVRGGGGVPVLNWASPGTNYALYYLNGFGVAPSITDNVLFTRTSPLATSTSLTVGLQSLLAINITSGQVLASQMLNPTPDSIISYDSAVSVAQVSAPNGVALLPTAYLLGVQALQLVVNAYSLNGGTLGLMWKYTVPLSDAVDPVGSVYVNDTLIVGARAAALSGPGPLRFYIFALDASSGTLLLAFNHTSAAALAAGVTCLLPGRPAATGDYAAFYACYGPAGGQTGPLVLHSGAPVPLIAVPAPTFAALPSFSLIGTPTAVFVSQLVPYPIAYALAGSRVLAVDVQAVQYGRLPVNHPSITQLLVGSALALDSQPVLSNGSLYLLNITGGLNSYPTTLQVGAATVAPSSGVQLRPLSPLSTATFSTASCTILIDPGGGDCYVHLFCGVVGALQNTLGGVIALAGANRNGHYSSYTTAGGPPVVQQFIGTFSSPRALITKLQWTWVIDQLTGRLVMLFQLWSNILAPVPDYLYGVNAVVSMALQPLLPQPALPPAPPQLPPWPPAPPTPPAPPPLPPAPPLPPPAPPAAIVRSTAEGGMPPPSPAPLPGMTGVRVRVSMRSVLAVSLVALLLAAALQT